jgi:hypothetical protein
MNENYNVVYNILNSQTNQTLFYYCILFLIVIIIFTNIKISFTLFFGLIIYFTYVVYFTYNNNRNTTTNNEKFNIKKNDFENIPEKYKDIIDFLFYLQSFKGFSYILYNETEILINNFINLYDICINHYELVNDYYNTLYNLMLRILINIENFNLNGVPQEQIKENKEMIEKILFNYLNNLILINNKNNYYNGFDIYSKIIDNSTTHPYNLFNFENNYTNNILMSNINNYKFI